MTQAPTQPIKTAMTMKITTGLGVKSAKGQTGGSPPLRIAGAIFCGCWRVATTTRAGIQSPLSRPSTDRTSR